MKKAISFIHLLVIPLFMPRLVHGSLDQDTVKESANTPTFTIPRDSSKYEPSKSVISRTTSTTATVTSPTRLLKVDKNNDCLNNIEYFYKGNREKTCKWIQKKEERRSKLCQNLDVHTQCPKSCGVCCKDDSDYVFTIHESSSTRTALLKKKENDENAEKDCSWLATQDESQRNFYCGENNDENYSKWQNGHMIRDACRSTCGLCFSLIEVATEVESTDTANSTSSFPSSAPTNTASVPIINDSMDIIGSNELEKSDGMDIYDRQVWIGVSLMTAVYMAL